MPAIVVLFAGMARSYIDVEHHQQLKGSGSHQFLHYLKSAMCRSRLPRSWKTDSKTESVTRQCGVYLVVNLRTESFVNIDPFPASRFAVMHQQDGLFIVIEYNQAEWISGMVLVDDVPAHCILDII